jgi:hypothetical protein
MKELYEHICWLLDTTDYTIEEIADELKCPPDWVIDVVEDRCV